MILEMVSSAFAFVYLVFILEIIFSSTKNVLYNQQAFEGRLLFFIYSLIVYYSGIEINIFFFEQLLNQPIKQAYGLLDTFLSNFFGLSIAESPMPIFLYLMPASFIYHFVSYWFRYGFNDERIGRMAAFLGVVLFLNSGGLRAVLPWIIPVGTGIPFSLMAFTRLFGFFMPVSHLGMVAGGVDLGLDSLAGGGIVATVLQGFLVMAALFLIYFFGRMMFQNLMKSEKEWVVWLVVSLLLVTFGVSFMLSYFLFGKAFGAHWMEFMFNFWDVFMLLLIILGIAVLVELLTLGVIYAILGNVRKAQGLD